MRAQRVGVPVAAIATLFIMGGCAPASPAPTTPSPPATSTAPPSSVASPVAVAQSPTPAPTDQPLPNPGGTCRATQFTAGIVHLDGEPSTVFTEHVLVWEQLRNLGPACILAQPKIIGLAIANGPFTALSVPSLGELIYVGNAGHYIYPASYAIRAGASFRIDLNAYWWFGLPLETAPPQFPCHNPIAGISQAEVPLASGALRMAWSPPFGEVCTTPPSVSIGFDFT